MTQKKSVHSNQYSLGVNHVEALRTDGPPLGVKPAADTSIVKITCDCLFVRTAEGSIYGGRRGMSWWATVVTVFVFFFFSGGEYGKFLYDLKNENFLGTFSDHYLQNWIVPLGGGLCSFSWHAHGYSSPGAANFP